MLTSNKKTSRIFYKVTITREFVYPKSMLLNGMRSYAEEAKQLAITELIEEVKNASPNQIHKSFNISFEQTPYWYTKSEVKNNKNEVELKDKIITRLVERKFLEKYKVRLSIDTEDIFDIVNIYRDEDYLDEDSNDVVEGAVPIEIKYVLKPAYGHQVDIWKRDFSIMLEDLL